jgi:2-amino-4-hydroxy-6-hydroxymethyldihydropteridine diphosphokinase
MTAGGTTPQPSDLTPIAVALGSNVGRREEHLRYAVAALSSFVSDLRASPFIETLPYQVVAQPPFLNGAIVGGTRLAAADVLDRLLRIERERGRERPHVGAPRTLDLDLILFGHAVIDRPGLKVPHPRFRERRFVLEPLAAIAPDMVDPVTGSTVRELLERLGAPGAHRQTGGRSC